MIFAIALVSGVLPALLWLAFWLREDSRNPEPRGRIIAAFIGGMIAVPLVIPLEEITRLQFGENMLIVLILWSFIEEFMKYGAAYVTVLKKETTDEPIDPIIYLITAALGFAALENTLFLLTPIEGRFLMESIVTGNLRFIGATLLHTISSGVIGIFLSLSFYRRSRIKKLYTIAGLFTATVLHAVFNFLIITQATDNPSELFFIFFGVWVAVVALILFFERAKKVHPRM